MYHLKAAILIVSETASQDISTDKTTNALEDVFRGAQEGQWTTTHRSIVPDNILKIQAVIKQWTDGDDAVNLIVTSGGTGFGTQDVTPEVAMITIRVVDSKANRVAGGNTIAEQASTRSGVRSRPGGWRLRY